MPRSDQRIGSDGMPTTTPATPDFSIILVNHNAVAFLQRCLISIQRTRAALRLQVILVDNASTDDSVPAARTIMPELTCLTLSKNVGYVRANNLGLRHATGQYILYLNNDTELHPGCLSELLRFLHAHPRAGAVSPQILNPDGSDQGCARRFPSAINGIFGRRSWLTRWFPHNPWSRRYMLGRHQPGTEPFDVEMLSTACMAVPTALATALGGMDEGYRHYWVDADLCDQIHKLGFRVCCLPSARITHFEGQGGSTGTWRQRCRAILNFHRDAYRAYWRAHNLSSFHPLRWFAATALTTRAASLMLLQALRPGLSNLAPLGRTACRTAYRPGIPVFGPNGA
ncbi:MAG TPA: glycosyltransferase family 2 protein [Pirellulaceae bacterium]